MRIKIKKDIKSMMRSMLNAHPYVVKLLQNKQIAESREVLGQCQDCAEYIGKAIEECEGMGTQAVTYLEAYCEQIYKMCLTTNIKKLIKLKKQADDSLYKVEQEIDQSIPLDSPKIVFMPYKASMWDCMESVWEAAEADTDCDVYVVPIPYYERNVKGELEKRCYEGEKFPEYVPITSYEEFSLEKERPDIIYIHNPYDAGNYVTSVYPEYYSYNLKKYTDTLVYIPYFLSGSGPLPEAHRSLPAYLYIDKIVVQDKGKANSLSNYVPQDKIVIIGSPKVDHLMKLNKQKQIILKNKMWQIWGERIKDKKVILFNISLSGILQNRDYAMKKIRYVLSLFKKRDDIVLLWRPHPLIEATLKSMCPEMYVEYIQMKNSFIKEERGIFDETEDAGLAAIIADAYLGESTSSLVHYFGVLGKPVFFINWEEIEDRQTSRAWLSFNTYFVEENSLFFVPENKHLSHNLYKFDLKNGIVERMGTLPGTPDEAEQCYCSIKKVKNKIVLIPNNTEDIYVYDINKKQAVKIVLSEAKDNFLLFNDAVEYDGKLFLIPQCYPAIVSLDIKTLEVHEFKQCIKPYFAQNSNKILFSLAFFRKKQFLYLASCNNNRILIFNMDNGNFEIKQVGECTFGFGHMTYDGEYFWFSAYMKNCIVRWDENSGNTREYIYPIYKEYPLGDIWSLILDNEEEIIVCPGFSRDMIFINKVTGENRLFDMKRFIKNDIDSPIGAWEGFRSANYLDEKTVVFNFWKNRSIVLWDIKTNEWKSFLCRMSICEMLEVEKTQIERNWLVKAEPFYLSEERVSIPQFMDYIVGGDADAFKQSYSCYKIDEKGFTTGEKIHNYFMS